MTDAENFRFLRKQKSFIHTKKYDFDVDGPREFQQMAFAVPIFSEFFAALSLKTTLMKNKVHLVLSIPTSFLL